jgi:hypothetical protein
VGHANITIDNLKADVLDALTQRGVDSKDAQIAFARSFFNPVKFKDATPGDWQRLLKFIGWLSAESIDRYLEAPDQFLREFQQGSAVIAATSNVVPSSDADLFDQMLPPVERPKIVSVKQTGNPGTAAH